MSREKKQKSVRFLKDHTRQNYLARKVFKKIPYSYPIIFKTPFEIKLIIKFVVPSKSIISGKSLILNGEFESEI